MALWKSSVLVLLAVSMAIAGAAATMPVRVTQKDDQYSYALVGKDGNMTMNNWSMSTDDPLIKKGGPERLYVKKDGKVYIITDTHVLGDMKKAVAPMIAIGRKQSALGEQQSKIGEQQSAIGEKQSKLGEQMSEIGSQMSELAQKLAGNENSQDEYQAKQDDLQRKMEALQKQMDALNSKMDEPSKKQEALGKKQDALGREQDKASKIADKKIEKIIDSAFAKGLAKPV